MSVSGAELFQRIRDRVAREGGVAVTIWVHEFGDFGMDDEYAFLNAMNSLKMRGKLEFETQEFKGIVQNFVGVKCLVQNI